MKKRAPSPPDLVFKEDYSNVVEVICAALEMPRDQEILLDEFLATMKDCGCLGTPPGRDKPVN